LRLGAKISASKRLTVEQNEIFSSTVIEIKLLDRDLTIIYDFTFSFST